MSIKVGHMSSER